MKFVRSVLLILMVAFAIPATAAGGHKHSSGGSHSTTSHSSTHSASHSSHSSSKSSHSSSKSSTHAYRPSSRPRSQSASSHITNGHSSSHSKAATGVTRDSHGKIARSQRAKDDFKKSHPCPSTGKTSGACSGYIIDHVQALKRGGADSPSNMQWQTTAAAKSKDKWE
jgi:hypothetical protein